MKSIIKDLEKSAFFRERGYAIFKINDLKTLDDLSLLFETEFPDVFENIFVSHFNDNFAKNKLVSNSILKILKPEIDFHFNNYQSIIGHYVSKVDSNNEVFNLHQDWSYVDEEKYDVGHLWIPLMDVTIKNGCLFVLEKTHKNGQLRSASYGINSTPLNESNKDKITNIELKKGEFLFYHPALFHGSYPNNTTIKRTAVVVPLADKNTPLYYYDKIDGRKNIRSDFFLKEHFLINQL